jgi:hypothetical protein
MAKTARAPWTRPNPRKRAAKNPRKRAAKKGERPLQRYRRNKKF